MDSFWPLIGIWLLLLVTGQCQAQELTDAYAAEHRIRCNDDYCTDPASPVPECPAVQNCTNVGYREFLFPVACNCCPYCFDYISDGGTCVKVPNFIPAQMCGPMLQCNQVGDELTCGTLIGAPGTCSYELNEYNKRQVTGQSGIADWKPTCNAHGNYSPRQCLPASSICVCMNEEGGPIFGMGFAKDKMDCACSRDVDRLKSFGILGDAPHCLPNGDYDELQCFLNIRQCYCRLKPRDIVRMSEIANLTCYDPLIHNENYIRPCELARGEMESLIFGAQDNSSMILVGDMARCSPDGHFDPIQSVHPYWICVDPDGNQIEEFQMHRDLTEYGLNPNPHPSEPPPNMNCHCARARHFLGENLGKPKCCPNGSYRPWQCTGSTCYCVDLIGRQVMSEGPPFEVQRDDVDQLSCYDPVNSCVMT